MTHTRGATATGLARSLDRAAKASDERTNFYQPFADRWSKELIDDYEVEAYLTFCNNHFVATADTIIVGGIRYALPDYLLLQADKFYEENEVAITTSSSSSMEE